MTLEFFIAKVLVTTGYPLENGYHSEVIDLLNPNSTCDSLPDFPVQIHSGILITFLWSYILNQWFSNFWVILPILEISKN